MAATISLLFTKTKLLCPLLLALIACRENPEDPAAESQTETETGDGDGDSGDGDGDSGDGDGDSGDGDGDSGDGDGDGDSGDGDGDGDSGDGDGDGDSGDGDGDSGDGDGDGDVPSPCIEQPAGWSSVLVGATPGEIAWSNGEAFVAYENYSVLIYDGENTRELATGGFINQVWVNALDDVWIAAGETAQWLYSAGAPGKLWHFDGECLSLELEPSDELGFAGITGTPDGTQMWALEEAEADSCENLCDGEVASWHFADGQWTLDDQRLATSGESTLAPRLTYDGERAWSYLGDRPRFWTAQGWQNASNAHASSFITSGELWWAYDGDDQEGEIAYFDGQGLTKVNVGEAYFEPDPPNFSGVMGPRVDHDPVLAWTTAYIPEQPTVLVQLDGIEWSELALLPDDIIVSDLGAWSSDELLLSTYTSPDTFHDRRYELADLSGPEPLLSSLVERSNRSCSQRLLASDDELLAYAGRSIRQRDGLGEWSQRDHIELDHSILGWLAGPEDGWLYDEDDGLYRYGPDGPELYEDSWGPDEPFVQVRELWGTASDDVYVLHSNFSTGWLFHWDGASWTDVTPEGAPRLHQLHVAGDTLLIAAEGELLLRSDGVWDSIPVEQPGINYQNSRVWVSGPERLWFAAGGVGLLTWDGVELLDAAQQWPELDQQLDLASIRIVAGTGEDFFAHSRGKISHFDGLDWTELEVPTFESVSAMAWTGEELVVDSCARVWSFWDAP